MTFLHLDLGSHWKSNNRNYFFLQENFVFPKFLTCHFDGKQRKEWGKKHDFIAICVTGAGMEKEKFLADAPLESGTGAAMAWEVFRVLEDWAIDKRIIAFSTDSTSSNTGIDNG